MPWGLTVPDSLVVASGRWGQTKCSGLWGSDYLGPERLMHECMCESVWIWSLLPSFQSGQGEAVQSIVLFSLFFLSWKGTTEILNSLFTNTVPKPVPLLCESSRALTPRTPPLVWESRTGGPGWLDIRGLWGREKVSIPNPSLNSHPPHAAIRPVSHPFNSPWRGEMLLGQGRHPRPIKWSGQSFQGRELSLRRCC